MLDGFGAAVRSSSVADARSSAADQATALGGDARAAVVPAPLAERGFFALQLLQTLVLSSGSLPPASIPVKMAPGATVPRKLFEYFAGFFLQVSESFEEVLKRNAHGFALSGANTFSTCSGGGDARHSAIFSAAAQQNLVLQTCLSPVRVFSELSVVIACVELVFLWARKDELVRLQISSHGTLVLLRLLELLEVVVALRSSAGGSGARRGAGAADPKAQTMEHYTDDYDYDAVPHQVRDAVLLLLVATSLSFVHQIQSVPDHTLKKLLSLFDGKISELHREISSIMVETTSSLRVFSKQRVQKEFVDANLQTHLVSAYLASGGSSSSKYKERAQDKSVR